MYLVHHEEMEDWQDFLYLKEEGFAISMAGAEISTTGAATVW